MRGQASGYLGIIINGNYGIAEYTVAGDIPSRVALEVCIPIPPPRKVRGNSDYVLMLTSKLDPRIEGNPGARWNHLFDLSRGGGAYRLLDGLAIDSGRYFRCNRFAFRESVFERGGGFAVVKIIKSNELYYLVTRVAHIWFGPSPRPDPQAAVIRSVRW